MNPPAWHLPRGVPGRTRRYVAAIGVLVGAVTVGLAAPAQSRVAAAVDEPPDMPPPAVTRIASFNTASFLSTRAAVRDIKAVANSPVDILALQEMSSPERRDAVRAALVDCDGCVFDMFVPAGGAVPAGTPILYRRDRFWVIESGSVQVTEETYVGPRGAGPSTIRPKYVNWLRLRDRLTRRQVYVLNNHTVPTVQAPDGGPNDNKERLAIYRRHMAGLTALVTQLSDTGGAMFVTGDFNVNYRKDRVVATSFFPYAALGRVAVHASYEHTWEPEIGTHILPSGFDMRLIDYVSILDRRPVEPLGNHVIRGLNSDHRPIVAKVALRYQAKFYR